jgi:hypothetical protein
VPEIDAPVIDQFGRTPIADGMKKQIADAFKAVPETKRGAVVVIHDIDTNTTRAHLAAKIGDSWKVAAGGGFAWTGQKPDGWFGVMKDW